MAEVLWREKMRRRAEITAVFLGTYQPRGLWAFAGGIGHIPNSGVGEG